MTKVSDKSFSEVKSRVDLQDVYERELVEKRHRCTDILCLILFFIFLLVQVILSLIIFLNAGDPRNIILPHDSSGQICKDSQPDLLYFNLLSCLNINAFTSTCQSPTVCVSSCPSQNYFYLIKDHRDFMYNNYCRQDLLKKYFNSSSSLPTASSIDETKYYDLAKLQICPLYALSSTEFYGRCLPSIVSLIGDTITNLYANDSNTNKTFQITDLTNAPLTDQLVKKAAKYITDLLQVKTIAQFVMEDFLNSAVLIVVLLIIAAIVSFIYIVVLRWIIAPLIYLTLIFLVAGLSFAVYFCITKYISLKDSPNSFQFTTDVSYYFKVGTTWLVIGIIAAVILFIVLLLILVLIKRLHLAIQLITEASKAVSSVILTLVFPLVPLILKIGLFAYFVAVAVYLACAGNSIFQVANSTNSSSSCDPTQPANFTGILCVFYKIGFDFTSPFNSVMSFLSTYQWIPQLFNAFMMFWCIWFVVGFNQMVLAGCYGIWYWSKSKSSCILCTSIKDTLVYHMGSIAFGSFLIALCKLIRLLIEFVEKRVKNASGNNSIVNCIVSFVSCCCKCCFWCLEQFIKFINRNAYIMIAIYGKNFCSSAKDALELLASNPLRALVLDRVTDFILFLGRLFITVGVGILSFYFFSKSFYIDPNYRKYFAPELHYYWLPLVAVIVATYFISKTFFAVFEMAVDTIFLCAMKDLSIHDGTPEKPYFMSTKMLKILNVKNENPVESQTERI